MDENEKLTLQNWDGINFKKIKEYQSQLEQYNGYLPIILHHHINITNRKEYLNSIGEEYEYKDILKHRNSPQDLKRDKQEIIDFINQNPQFKEIIKIKE